MLQGGPTTLTQSKIKGTSRTDTRTSATYKRTNRGCPRVPLPTEMDDDDEDQEEEKNGDVKGWLKLDGECERANSSP